MYDKIIREILEKKNISLLGLAKELNIPYRTLQDWKACISIPDASGKWLLSHLLHCNTAIKRKKGTATPKIKV